MALRTRQEFVNSLRDGREVYVKGQRVEDVTEHPYLRLGIATAAVEYELAHDPANRDFAVVEEDGQSISRYLQQPRSAHDLEMRRLTTETGSRICYGFPPFAKEGGCDALNATIISTKHVDEKHGTEYHQRASEFRRYMCDNDLSIAIAMTDVKGDRSRRPSQQTDPDLYLHIVEERADGIVVRGAKAHLTSGPYTNEILVLPTRNMGLDDKGYAVAFALPANSQGLKLIVKESPYESRSPDDYPISARWDIIEALAIFDNVFVPWERVFLKGEHEYAHQFVEMFANYHRVTASAYKYPYLELLVGAALLSAEVNGLDRVGHIRDKVAELVIYAETVRSLTQAACANPVTDPATGMVYPDPVLGNAAKFHFANNYHQAVRNVQDIAGGLTVTSPSTRDFANEDLRPYLDKYLKGRDAIPADARFKAFRLVRDLTASDMAGFWEVTTIHAEGSLAAERMAALASADLQSYRRRAIEKAHIEPWEG